MAYAARNTTPEGYSTLALRLRNFVMLGRLSEGRFPDLGRYSTDLSHAYYCVFLSHRTGARVRMARGLGSGRADLLR